MVKRYELSNEQWRPDQGPSAGQEAVQRDDAPPLAVGLPEGRQTVNGLALVVDRLAASIGVLAPMGDEASAQRIERDFAGLMIASDYQQVLAGCGVPTRRVVVHAAVAHVDAIHNGIPKRPSVLPARSLFQADLSIGRKAAAARSPSGRSFHNSQRHTASSP